MVEDGGCWHLKEHLSTAGTNSYAIIHAVFVSAITPAFRVKKCHFLHCHICNLTNGRLHSCLNCIFFGCLTEGHIKQHAFKKGHGLAVDLSYGNIYCFKCDDYVYDSKLEEIGLSYTLMAAMSFGAPGWNITEDEMTLLKLHHPQRSLSNMQNFGMRGLVNLGNTCFMNSIIQALTHTPLLRDFFLCDKHSCDLDDDKCLACEVARLFQEFYSGTKKPLVLDRLLHMIWTYKCQLAGYEQQDAHEFFIAILDVLHRHCRGTDPNSVAVEHCNCIIDQIFTGQMQSDVVCQSCFGVSTTIEPFWDISLDLGPSVPTKSKAAAGPSVDMENAPTLLDCLARFTQAEHLGPSAKIKCNTCESYQESTKQLTMRKLPIVVSFHLKRFEHSTMFRKKISTYIKFPEYLDMTPFTSSYHDEMEMPSPSKRAFKSRDNRYCLFAVVNHWGSMNSGHYTVFVRQQRNRWYKCDDNSITHVSIDDVLKSEGYLLLYHKRMLYYA